MNVAQLRASRSAWRLRERAALRRYRDKARPNAEREKAREEYKYARARRQLRDTQLAARLAPKGVVSDRGVELIAKFEGGASPDGKFRPYKDAVGVWTIGYGHTGPDVHQLGTLTQPQAFALLKRDVNRFALGVKRIVKVPLNQNQFDALVSFAYNVGIGAFANSTLLKLLNSKRYTAAANQLPRWNKGGGRVLEGLTRRRNDERRLFLTR